MVLAGPGLHLTAEEGHWDEVCRLLRRGARDRDLATGFEQAIAHAGAHMAQAFPRKRGEARPQLADRLRILHEAF